MRTVLLILASYCFICAFSFLLAGFIGLVDLENRQPSRPTFFGVLFGVLDYFLCSGWVSLILEARRNWKSHTYERHVFLAGLAFLDAAALLVMVAVAVGGKM